MPGQDTAAAIVPIIILLGETGSGKSNFISVAGKPSLKPAPKVSGNVKSCTKHVKAFKVENSRPKDGEIRSVAHVHLVDTPGFDDSSLKPDHEILEDIVKWLNEEPNTTVAGILWLQNMNNGLNQNIRKICHIPGISLVTWFSYAVEKKKQEGIDSLRLRQHQFSNEKHSAWDIIENVLASNPSLTRGALATLLQDISKADLKQKKNRPTQSKGFFRTLM